MKVLVIDDFFQIKLPPAIGVKELLQNYLASAEINLLFTTPEIWQESSLSLSGQLTSPQAKWSITVKRSLIPRDLPCDHSQGQGSEAQRGQPHEHAALSLTAQIRS